MDKEEWLQLEETVALKNYILNELAELKETWSSGGFTHITIDATAMKNAEKIGEVSAYLDVLDELGLDASGKKKETAHED